MFNILIVEDSMNIRKLMAARLEKEGYAVFQAENGKAALDEVGYVEEKCSYCNDILNKKS